MEGPKARNFVPFTTLPPAPRVTPSTLSVFNKYLLNDQENLRSEGTTDKKKEAD